MSRCVSGVTSKAFVPSGTASRLIGGGAWPSTCPVEYGSNFSPIVAGVGVSGGSIGLDTRFLFGVDGASSLPIDETPFGALFLLLLAFAFGDGAAASTSSLSEAALNRADLLGDIVIDWEQL